MKRVRVGLLFLLMLGCAGPLDAAPLYFDFSLNFTSGFLAGQSATGIVGVDGDDCPGGVCNGTFTPDPYVDELDLIQFDITVDGVPFVMWSDEGYPFHPEVVISNGRLTSFDYYGESESGDYWLALQIRGLTAQAYNGQSYSDGTVSTTPQPVPEPTSLLLLGSGLVAVARWRNRRKF